MTARLIHAVAMVAACFSWCTTSSAFAQTTNSPPSLQVTGNEASTNAAQQAISSTHLFDIPKVGQWQAVPDIQPFAGQYDAYVNLSAIVTSPHAANWREVSIILNPTVQVQQEMAGKKASINNNNVELAHLSLSYVYTYDCQSQKVRLEGVDTYEFPFAQGRSVVVDQRIEMPEDTVENTFNTMDNEASQDALNRLMAAYCS